ncbi:MAG: hypothetical protein UX04_C0003G0045 [Microgenomates group bacterium GW2011_GWF2_45_18]|nr:MAG: hypothetical protein UW18_C0002G0045 [Microgenomates group bacterium GW2011_GWF1_44_10]KKU01773.1 MAG: hypothetical protein UX04_C0003G0045 [Microgenomates group bacterium GW2011_GWF2_45_18]OGJ41488.1 MAG: hypothetical protein A2378_04410 [Candidatus Pacebacteria bacterium RIFOXYB1_FULL_44_10]HAU98923.1 hypothetical protein [Candidatus Paceibacterota bacterium]HAX01120.1 hypothetical protein [Candidatus Paceibacterota bacterium]
MKKTFLFLTLFFTSVFVWGGVAQAAPVYSCKEGTECYQKTDFGELYSYSSSVSNDKIVSCAIECGLCVSPQLTTCHADYEPDEVACCAPSFDGQICFEDCVLTPALIPTGANPPPLPLNPAKMRDTINNAIQLNKIGSQNVGVDPSTLTLGQIIAYSFPFLFAFAGFTLFVMIVWGGFEMLLGATDQKAQEAGKNRITWAVVGFLLLFLSYWIGQIIEIVFGINIFL